VNILIVTHPTDGERQVFLIRDPDAETLRMIEESKASNFGGRLADKCANGDYEQVIEDIELKAVRIVNIFPA
jgi:hypothetical protein